MNHTENDAYNSSSIVASIRYHGNVFNRPLPSSDGKYD
jgi:hypothetical protein